MKYITLLILSAITISSGFAPSSNAGRKFSSSTTSLWAGRPKIGKGKPVAEKPAAKTGKGKPVAKKTASKEAKPGFSLSSFGGGGDGGKKKETPLLPAKKGKLAKKSPPAKKSSPAKKVVEKPSKATPAKAGFSFPSFGGGEKKKESKVSKTESAGKESKVSKTESAGKESKVSKTGSAGKKAAFSSKKEKVQLKGKPALSKKSKPAGKKVMVSKVTKTKAPQKTRGTVKVVQVARPNGSFEVKLVGDVPPFFKK